MVLGSDKKKVDKWNSDYNLFRSWIKVRDRFKDLESKAKSPSLLANNQEIFDELRNYNVELNTVRASLVDRGGELTLEDMQPPAPGIRSASCRPPVQPQGHLDGAGVHDRERCCRGGRRHRLLHEEAEEGFGNAERELLGRRVRSLRSSESRDGLRSSLSSKGQPSHGPEDIRRDCREYDGGCRSFVLVDEEQERVGVLPSIDKRARGDFRGSELGAGNPSQGFALDGHGRVSGGGRRRLEPLSRRPLYEDARTFDDRSRRLPPLIPMEKDADTSTVAMIWMGVVTVLLVGGAVYFYKKLKGVGE